VNKFLVFGFRLLETNEAVVKKMKVQMKIQMKIQAKKTNHAVGFLKGGC
jgi:hypothetical protein